MIWPGNLRELHRVVQTIVLFTKGDTVLPENILLDSDLGAGFPRRETAAENTPQPAETAPAPTAATAPDGDLSLAAAERRHIEHVYTITGGNKRQTARILGISRSTLDRKLKGTAVDK